MFRTETLRVDFAYPSSQSEAGQSQSIGDFAGFQSAARTNLGLGSSSSGGEGATALILQSPLRVNLGRGGKNQRIASVSTEQVLTLSSAYFQFLTPTASSVVVKLPSVTANDYFEGEIANVGDGSNALAIQEFSGTAIVTLENSGDKARSVYAYWDGATWHVWIRGYY